LSMEGPGRSRWGRAIALVAIATGIYQSLLLLFVALVCVAAAGDALQGSGRADNGSRWYDRLMRAAVVAVGAVALNQVCLVASRTIFRVEPEYLDTWIKFDQLASADHAALRHTIGRAWRLFSGADQLFLGYGRWFLA